MREDLGPDRLVLLGHFIKIEGCNKGLLFFESEMLLPQEPRPRLAEGGKLRERLLGVVRVMPFVFHEKEADILLPLQGLTEDIVVPFLTERIVIRIDKKRLRFSIFQRTYRVIPRKNRI